MNSIENTLKAIKEQTGLELIPCDYFTGINKMNGKEYFNVITPDSIVGGSIYNRIKGLIQTGLISGCEPNGVSRVAIFF